MTIKCPACDSINIKPTDDNGAEYPNTRVEWYECQNCGNKQKKVLTA